MTKSAREIMEILEAYDLTRCAHSAAELAGCDEKTVIRYVAMRDAGGDPTHRPHRPKTIDPYLDKIEELVGKSRGRIRADVVHRRLLAMGFTGTDRSTRRAVAQAKDAWRAGNRRRYRPWIPEPGMWLQFDWGDGPRVGGRPTQLFCAWLAWSRFRIVLPTFDQRLPTLIACLDTTLRRIGGVPTYLLTDNPRTVTTDRVAGIPVHHPNLVAAARHYGCVVRTCEPYDPESKGGSEHTVKIAKAEVVPTSANLLDDYPGIVDLADACLEFCDRVNQRIHRMTMVPPAQRWALERGHLHPLPAEPFLTALGEERRVNDDQTIRWGNVPYSTPDGYQNTKVCCRVETDELIIVARTPTGLSEIARHRLSTPGNPVIVDAHYPHHPDGSQPRRPRPRPRSELEIAFCDLGEGAHQWLVEAAATGTTKIKTKMRRAIEVATLVGADRVDQALGLAAAAGRFEDADLTSICDHLAHHKPPTDLVIADETHSAQPGTQTWEGFGS
jgi:transposase